MCSECNAVQEHHSNVVAVTVDALENLCRILSILEASDTNVTEKALTTDELIRIRELSQDVEVAVGRVSDVFLPKSEHEVGSDTQIPSLIEEELSIRNSTEELLLLILGRLGDHLCSDCNDYPDQAIELVGKIAAYWKESEVRKGQLLGLLSDRSSPREEAGFVDM